MAQLTIHLTLPDEIGEELKQRASQEGHQTIDDYVRALLIQELDRESEDCGAPSHLSMGSEEQLNELLNDRVDDRRPPIEGNETFWESVRQRARGAD